MQIQPITKSSTITNNPPVSSPSSIIEQAELVILNKKIQIMQIVCSTFYNFQHRCVLSHIIALTLDQKRKVIPVEDLKIFQNSLSILIDLKQGYFVAESFGEINGQEKKQSKKEKNKFLFLKLNVQGFFKIIRKILTDIQTKFQKIMKLYTVQQKSNQKDNNQESQIFLTQKKPRKKCKRCDAIQNEYLISLGWAHCTNQILIQQGQKTIKTQCGSTQFEDFILSLQQKNRIQKIRQIIEVVYLKIKEIQDLEYKLQNRMQEIKEIEKEQKTKQIDRFMKEYEELLNENKINIKLDQDYETISEAERCHAPKLRYEKVMLMKQCREERSRSRCKMQERC